MRAKRHVATHEVERRARLVPQSLDRSTAGVRPQTPKPQTPNPKPRTPEQQKTFRRQHNKLSTQNIVNDKSQTPCPMVTNSNIYITYRTLCTEIDQASFW